MSDFLTTGMGDKLKKVRKVLGLTQTQLAEKLGVKQSYYSLIEAGKAGIPIAKAPVLFSDLGVSEKWFFDLNNEISDKYMLDSANNMNTWENQKNLEKDSVLNKDEEKSSLKALITEKNERIKDLTNLVETKDELIKLLYSEIDRLKTNL